MDFGNGVSRTLNAVARQFAGLIWQEGKVPSDSELNYLSQVEWEALRQSIKAKMPSGFLTDPVRALDDYQFDPLWSNRFVLGRSSEGREFPVTIANVNGWLIPVVGTDIQNDVTNAIKLYPPPATGSRVDYVFLEAWLARIDANPSTVNKPSASTIWNYGNVKYGGQNLPDDLEDPAIGFSTTGRLQVQYRIRVFGQGEGGNAGVTLEFNPDGLGDPRIFGQGTANSPVWGQKFTNMKDTLGDPSLWRAGDGDPSNELGTIDGYVYAIPICAIFRRNTTAYKAVGPDNHNGSKDRTPHTKMMADPLDGARILLQASIKDIITAQQNGTFTVGVENLNGCGLEDPDHEPFDDILITIDDEVFSIDQVDLVNETIRITGRGLVNSAITRHKVGALIGIYNTRPDGLYADQIAKTDILDLRRSVTSNDWDYQRLLQHSVASLLKGELKSTWKTSHRGNSRGTLIHQVDYMLGHGGGEIPSPSSVTRVDGPDGIRTVWSDAAVIQRDVTLLLDNKASKVNQFADSLDANVAWDVGPDFRPKAFFNTAGYDAGGDVWTNGSVVFLHLGGEDGTGGARATFAYGAKDVRALMPNEYWKSNSPKLEDNNGDQNPITMRFLGEAFSEPPPEDMSDMEYKTRHPGPLYPWSQDGFESPFIVLGGLVHGDLQVTGHSSANFRFPVGNTQYLFDSGINFDDYGVFYTTKTGVPGGVFENDPSKVSKPLCGGRKTLWGLLTDDGKDLSGRSSKLYLLTYGDTSVDGLGNNWVFKVVGAGSVGYTKYSVPDIYSEALPISNCLFLESVSNKELNIKNDSGGFVTFELRSLYSNADDLSSAVEGSFSNTPANRADIAVALTDLEGTYRWGTPWNPDNLGSDTPYDRSIKTDTATGLPYIDSKMLLNMTLLYHPGRSGMARVPDQVLTFAKKYDPTVDLGGYLRQSQDTTSDETYWDPVHVQTWNRLPAQGRHAPDALNMGGGVVGFTEQDREHELFIDKGSKTVVFRPFRDREMTLQAINFSSGALPTSLIGEASYPAPLSESKDGGDIWTSGKRMGFPIPREYMPRFGRQDIPYWNKQSNDDPFMSGINHLFTDNTDPSSVGFNIIGGESNQGSGSTVKPLFFTATADVGYCHRSTLAGSPLNQPCIGARKTTDILDTDIKAKLAAVHSSDLGKGLKGIMLPPYHGPARIYGVYRAEDFYAKGGLTFNSDRNTPVDNPPPNLLRTDAVNQTLFILEGGAKDVTGSNLDHTYILPCNAIDITKALGYTEGDRFEDYEYIVECTVFGFARGFINKNNYVLCRRYNGSGESLTDTDDPFELEGVRMTIPAPAGLNDHLYVAYNRTPYQGDPFMTRGGDVLEPRDYGARYGQVNKSDQYKLRIPIQQFDDNGEFVPEIPNARAFEILASMDFYTTLGTGKIGGQMYPGTVLDSGFVENNANSAMRMPVSENAASWRVEPRAFTEGQDKNPTRAKVNLALMSGTSRGRYLNPGKWHHAVVKLNLPDGGTFDLYASYPKHVLDITGTGPGQLGLGSEHVWLLDDGAHLETKFQDVELSGLLNPGQVLSFEVYLDHLFQGFPSEVSTTAELLSNFAQYHPPLSFHIAAHPGQNHRIYLKVSHMITEAVIKSLPRSFEVLPFNTTANPIAVGEKSVLINTVSVVDIGTDDSIVVLGKPPGIGSHALYTAKVIQASDGEIPGEIEITCHNIGTNSIPVGPHGPTQLAIIKNAESSSVNLDGLTVRLTHTLAFGSDELNASSLANQFLKFPLGGHFSAWARGRDITLYSHTPGTQGNDAQVHMAFWSPDPAKQNQNFIFVNDLESGPYDIKELGLLKTSANFSGGKHYPANAGKGFSQIDLTGMTERLPLGALLQDSDFICENPLDDESSALKTSVTGPRPIQNALTLTTKGEEFTRFMGEPGSLIMQSDGYICVEGNFTPWTNQTLYGTKLFRIYRGSGPLAVLSGDNPGGPVDWVADTIPAPMTPVLKGGILACRAMLVRNFQEDVTVSGNTHTVSYGDEIQLVVATNGILADGNSRENGLLLNGLISPSGYGEGLASSDRYRINGHPMYKGPNQWTPNPQDLLKDKTKPGLAVYPDGLRQLKGNK